MLESMYKTWGHDLINGPVIWRCLMVFVDWAELYFFFQTESARCPTMAEQYTETLMISPVWQLIILLIVSWSFSISRIPTNNTTNHCVVSPLHMWSNPCPHSKMPLIYSKQQVPGLGLWKFLLAITFSLLAHGIMDAWATPFKASPSYSRPFTEKGEKGH